MNWNQPTVTNLLVTEEATGWRLLSRSQWSPRYARPRGLRAGERAASGETGMLPVHSISELVLEVRDLAQAEHFYGEVLGFELKRWDARVTVAEAPGCRIQLR